MANHEVPQPPGTKPGFFYGYIVVVAVLCIMVVIWGTFYTFGVFFTPLLNELGWTRAVTSGAFSLAMIMFGLLGIIMGGLSDRFGPRMVMTFCGFLIGSGYLLMSQVNTAWQLYLFYGVVMGAGLGGAFVPLVSAVARWFVKRRGIMTGIVVSGIAIGALIGPLVANWLISTYGWRVSYMILGSTVLVIVILAAQFLRRDPTQVGQMAYGEDEGEERRLRLETEGFSLREAIYTRQFWITLAMLFFYGFSLFTIIVHITPHAIELGISAATAATILATIGIMSIFSRIVLGSASDRIGNRQVFIIGFILMSAALFWLVPATEIWKLYLFAGVFGFAYGGGGASESPLVAALFGLRSHGLILGVINLGVTTGGAVGPFVAGYIFDVTGSYQIAFVVCAVTAILGLTLAVALRSVRETGGKI